MKHCYFSEEYPMYTFSKISSNPITFKILMKRGYDATLMIELLVGETLFLKPLKYNKRNDHILCKILSIEQSRNGRRCDVEVDPIF